MTPRSPINPHGLPTNAYVLVTFEDGTTMETTLLPSRYRNLDVEQEVETFEPRITDPWKVLSRPEAGEIDFVRMTIVGGTFRSVLRTPTTTVRQVGPEAISG